MTGRKLRHLIVVLGDQLNVDSAALDGIDPEQDALWMAENHSEATHVWCHKRRLVLFFAAMRHYRDARRAAGLTVHYHALGTDPDTDQGEDFAAILSADLARLRPKQVVMVEPGDYRVRQMLAQTCERADQPLQVRPDHHFYCAVDEFQDWAAGRRSLLLENFYRRLRIKHDILMDGDDPVGSAWNFDRDNRKTFGRRGPGELPTLPHFPADAITREVMDLVAIRFGNHPGSLDDWDLPLTPADAQRFLDDFITQRLPDFGAYEDAMWEGEDFLYHSRLSVLLNLKLLNPRDCVARAVQAWQAGEAPLNSVEGFVRQILGWREYIRGVYWLRMPGYADGNALDCEDRDVPAFYWHGETDMACVAGAMRAVVRHGYTHHIQRLMVLGLFAQLAGVHPYRFHQWHMAMYLDAVDWVSLPNALGMSQYGDGGTVGSKPYCASGNYIHKMSNYCGGCRYHHQQAVGDSACPFTTLYWDFLARHRQRFAANNRMALQIKNLDRKTADDLAAIRQRAQGLKAALAQGKSL